MISIEMSSLWGDDTEQIVKGVTEATNNIISYHNNPNTSKNMLLELVNDIQSICSFWTGNTYVGIPKIDIIKNTSQSFFESLMQLLLAMKDSEKVYESTFAYAILYRGTVYRYLSDNFNDRAVAPIYDNAYVSWSKEPNNDYILSKLYGTITWISCKISEPLYGIDLDAIGCSKESEHEVVFPTIEKYITEIKYFSEDKDVKT